MNHSEKSQNILNWIKANSEHLPAYKTLAKVAKLDAATFSRRLNGQTIKPLTREQLTNLSTYLHPFGYRPESAIDVIGAGIIEPENTI